MVKSKIFLIVIFFILTSAFISLFSEENSSENTVKVGINNFLSKKQKQLIYFLIKDGLTSWSSNSKTKNSIFDDLDVIKVSTDKLFKDYNENEIKADNIYRNKKIVLSGVISSINRGIGEQYFVDFVSPKSFSSISAFFDDEYKEKLSKLKRHKNFSVFCIGECHFVIEHFYFFRSKWKVRNVDVFNNTCATELSSRVKRDFQPFVEGDIKAKDLRAIYATIACHLFKPSAKLSDNSYIADILGHSKNDLTTCQSYIDFYYE